MKELKKSSVWKLVRGFFSHQARKTPLKFELEDYYNKKNIAQNNIL